jgi:hypothetical protein
MAKDTQSRKYLITVNNPKEKDLPQDKIKEILHNNFQSLIYFCMSDEIGGAQKTYHTHIFIQFSSPVRFSQVKKNFPSSHIDRSKGTSIENRDYVFKKGKWANSDKSSTNLPNTHFEFGDIPEERPGSRSDLTELYQAIKDGLTTAEIVENYPKHMMHITDIERTRRIILEEEYRTTFRDLKVVYIHGETGVGKTRTIMEHYGYDKVFRVTNYKNPFDSYNQEPILVLDEYVGQFTMQNLLNYLDGYPLSLPSRYSDKIACYCKVFIISNLSLDFQYFNIQKDYKKVWKAFLRRLHSIYEMTDEGFYPYDFSYFGGEENIIKNSEPLSKEKVISNDFFYQMERQPL